MQRILLAGAVIFLVPFLLFAQPQTQTQSQSQSQPAAPPGSDLFLAELSVQNGTFHVAMPVNITKRKGYDSQPRFLPDGGSLLFTSIGDDGQADIYLYDIKSGSSRRLTNTKESEYSGTLMPDGKFVSVVRVEADETQRLWKFPFKGGEPSLVLESIKPVGYHAWIDTNTVVVFILGEPDTLQLVDLRTGKAEVIADKIGRSIHVLPGSQKVLFAKHAEDKSWEIEEFDKKTRKIRNVAKAVAGTEECDFVADKDGNLLMALDSKLFQWHKNEWREVADFTSAGLHGITRIAISPKKDRIALVAAE